MNESRFGPGRLDRPRENLNQLSVVDIREALENCENIHPDTLAYICAELLRRLLAREMHL